MLRLSAYTALLTFLYTATGLAQDATAPKTNEEKLADDPTRVETKIGVSYTDEFSINGSLAFGPVTKVNVRVKDDLEEWRIGGSVLTDFGIFNFNFGTREFDSGADQTNYSIGTFVPLSVFGIAPYGVQIFPTAGYTYNEGKIVCENIREECQQLAALTGVETVLINHETSSGYLGVFALKPVNSHWTILASTGYSLGSDDYSGYWVAGGIGYKINDSQSMNIFAYSSDNDYGSDSSLGFSYRYGF